MQDISGQQRVKLFKNIVGKNLTILITCAKTILFTYSAPPTCWALLLEQFLEADYLSFYLMDMETEAQGS